MALGEKCLHKSSKGWKKRYTFDEFTSTEEILYDS